MKRSNELLLYFLGFALLIGIGALVALRYFSGASGETYRGNKDMVEISRNLQGFEALSVAGEMEVELSQGDYAVTLHGESNILEHIETEVSGDGVLRIKPKSRVRLKPTQPVVVRASAPGWSVLKVAGICHVRSTGESLQSESLVINVAGASTLDLNIQTLVTEIKLAGACSARLSGSSELLEADMAGSCKLDAGKLQAHSVAIKAAGACNATVRADAELDAKLSGACHLQYYGNPRISQKTSGACSITPVDE